MQAFVSRAQRWLLAAAVLAALGPLSSPPVRAADQVVNGYNVIEIFFRHDTKKTEGGLHTFGGGLWQLSDAAGTKTTFRFREATRDEWSVYLVDDSRNVEIQLDLFKKQVLYAPIGQPRTPLYTILSAR